MRKYGILQNELSSVEWQFKILSLCPCYRQLSTGYLLFAQLVKSSGIFPFLHCKKYLSHCAFLSPHLYPIPRKTDSIFSGYRKASSKFGQRQLVMKNKQEDLSHSETESQVRCLDDFCCLNISKSYSCTRGPFWLVYINFNHT